MSGDTGPMAGKTCIVTGPTSGIGFETAAGLASSGAHVVLACRDAQRGDDARARIVQRHPAARCTVLPLDLASQQSIREFADAFLALDLPLEVLVNNAAVILLSRETTTDGFEMQFGVNYLGPFMLTLLLLDRIKTAPAARIVNVSSVIHKNATIDFDDLQSEKSYFTLTAYGRSKLGNVLFTYALARRLKDTDVTANCLHPGVVRSGITRDLPAFLQPLAKLGGNFMMGPERGARTSLHLAMSPDVEGVTGKYFVKCRETPSAPVSHDVDLQERLWRVSAEMTGVDA